MPTQRRLWQAPAADAGRRRPAGTSEAEHYRVTQTWPTGDGIFPRTPDQAPALLTLVHRCGRALVRVLRGEPALALLFPSDGTCGAADWYHTLASNHSAAGLLRQVVASLPKERPLRILEVGAGTGATTQALLAVLPSTRTHYTFTDISAGFLTPAQERFAGYPFIDYQVLDLERDPCAQGFMAHSFDVVVAANVVHATQDLRQTLIHLRTLLAPAGLVLLIEGTIKQRWLDLTFGLLPGWWRFDDDVRRDYPLISAEHWLSLLEELEFDAGTAFAVADEGQYLLSARSPRSVEPPQRTTRQWLLLGSEQTSALLARELQARRQIIAAAANAWDSEDELCVVDLRALDAAADTADTAEQTLMATLALMQRSLARTQPTRLWLVTHGAQAIGDDEDIDPSQAALWGLVRGFSLEHPERFGALIDLPLDGEQSGLAATILAEDNEPQVSAARRAASCRPLSRLRPLPTQSS